MPFETVEATAADALASVHDEEAATERAPDPFAGLTFGSSGVTAPEPPAGLAPGDQIARVVASPEGDLIELYDGPTAGATAGALRETMTVAEAARQPAYSGAARLAPGSIAVVKPGGVIGPITHGHWQDEEIDVPVSVLTNGAETKILLLSGTPLNAGKYTLHLTLDRDRWAISTGSDPEQHYHDERAIQLDW